MEKDPIIMVPVHADDFKKLNEFAESAWIMREVTANPANAESIRGTIKETRRKLLHQVQRKSLNLFIGIFFLKHNTKLLEKLEKKKKPNM